ncbi:sulfite oxidase-like [Liolophura sinensis]|uniref:sulfite oxidase-like n=1 Tax=Liolophura sinensis TaxID=3198878 RepID=UPI0031581ACF
MEKKIWVTYKNGVYDITDYVPKHPGGSKILLGAGGSIEPFWKMYAAHENPAMYALLEKFRIGNIVETSKPVDMKDPFRNDPVRHPALRPNSVKPFNAEPPGPLLVDNFITPNELFFVRNHLPVPKIDIKNYKLKLGTEGGRKEMSYSLKELKSKFPKHEVAVTIQCAGNRRIEMSEKKNVRGLSWQSTAISTAVWSGVRLSDLLKHAGIDIDKGDYSHIQFEGCDKDPEGSAYGASIPIALAQGRKNDIIIAYEMNGEEIPEDHGYPLRVIIPGVVGARQVKWLGRILVSKNESDSHWQQKDYKGFNPSVDWDTVDFSKSAAVQDLPVVSTICEPEPGTVLDEDSDEVVVKGYAFSGGGRGIIRVDVSADGGKTWRTAELLDGSDQNPYRAWAWTLWEAVVPLPENHRGKVELISKAVDSSYNVQPDSVEGIWNLRGLLNNAWHRVPVSVAK